MEIQGSSRNFYFGILEPQVLRTKSGQNLSFRNAIRDLCRGENRHESLKRDQNPVKNFKLKPRFKKLAVANKCIFTCTFLIFSKRLKKEVNDLIKSESLYFPLYLFNQGNVRLRKCK